MDRRYFSMNKVDLSPWVTALLSAGETFTLRLSHVCGPGGFLPTFLLFVFLLSFFFFFFSSVTIPSFESIYVTQKPSIFQTYRLWGGFLSHSPSPHFISLGCFPMTHRDTLLSFKYVFCFYCCICMSKRKYSGNFLKHNSFPNYF